jgi:phosphopentomutase
MRAIIVVMDSVGIGAAPDASDYGDAGADTIGHIAAACMRGDADNDERTGPLKVPNLVRLGLAAAYKGAAGHELAGFDARLSCGKPLGQFGSACEISKGKDTPSGHWEIAGTPVPFEWGYFPQRRPCFPLALTQALCDRAELPGILGNCHASGTQIIAELGPQHLKSGRPICYTSADSVFQIAAHEEAFGLERLYQVCKIARELVDPLKIGRVIARPFIGASPNFQRTANRRDYSVPPPSSTLLDLATFHGRDVVTIGKIGDIFAHRGTGRVLKGDGNNALFECMLEGLRSLADGGLLFANFVDFDTVYGHRRDVAGYAKALEDFDSRLPRLIAASGAADLLVITADHGCDPTWSGTDHTREQVPVLTYCASRIAGPIGRRTTFADIGATAAVHLQLPAFSAGTPF